MRILLLVFTFPLFLTAQKRLFNETDLWNLKRLSGTAISNDGKWCFYQTTSYSVAENNGKSTGWLMNTATKKSEIIWPEGSNFANVLWTKENELVFLKNGTEIWTFNPQQKSSQQLATLSAESEGFTFSPDMQWIVSLQSVKVKQSVKDKNPDLPSTSGKVIDNLMYRHWNQWNDENVLHLMLYAKNGNAYTMQADIMENEPYASVNPPFGGIDDVTFSADGKTIFYSCKKKSGKDFALSTNTDIYAFKPEIGSSIAITAAKGYDSHPVISPDGKKMAWLSMATDGFESDKNRLFIRDIGSGIETDLTKTNDVTVEHFVFSPDNKHIYYTAAINGTKQVFEVETETGKWRQLTNDRCDIVGIAASKNGLWVERQSMNEPTDIWQVDLKTGKQTPVTRINEGLMSQIQLPEIEEHWIPTSDGKKMLTWLILPPGADKSKSYPALLYCQGGPQSPVSQFFSYRWNFLLMASHGYAVIAPNRRGLPGFGQEWNDEISKDWGGQAIRDYLSATDEMAKLPYIDENKLGAVGASYGGYSVYYLAGIHENRFKTFIAHCGLFNLESWYGTTEELFFANHDIGGPYWIPANKELYEKNSPHKLVDKWNTPMLVIEGGKDFRVPESEGMQAFQVLQLKGIPSKLLYFPDEGHWISKPQNSVLWNRTFFDWLDTYLK